MSECFLCFLQECGGRSDVGCCILTSEQHLLALFPSNSTPPAQTSFDKYSISERHKARHPFELGESKLVHVVLDHAHMGVGGERQLLLIASCVRYLGIRCET